MFAFITILSVIIVFILILYTYVTRNHNYWKSRGIPGPKPRPFFGNLLEIFQKPLSDIEEKRFKQFGRIHGFYDFNTPILTVGEPELIKQILVKDFNSFINRRKLKVNSKFINNFLIVIRDENWKRLRAITSPTFSSGKLKKMFAMIDNCVDAVINKLDEYATNGTDVDLKWLFGSYTMNVIAKCAFATDTNALEDKNNPFVYWGSKVINVPLWRQIFFSIMPGFILDILQFTIAVPESFEFFRKVAKHVLNDRKTKSDSKQFNDFLQLLVDAETNESALEEMSESNEELTANKKALKLSSNLSKKLSEEEIIANIVLFLVAGYETTASLLSFSAYNLALNPESQQKLFEELKSNAMDLTYESISKLSYLDSVVCETLRLNNPVTRVEREANEDYVLAGTGIELKRGSIVAIPIHAIHHDPEFYPNPHQFSPERFYGEHKNNINAFTFLPFGSGPRNCIGMRFALIEAKLALARTVLSYKFSKCAKTEVPLKYMNTRPGLLQAISVWVKVERRI